MNNCFICGNPHFNILLRSSSKKDKEKEKNKFSNNNNSSSGKDIKIDQFLQTKQKDIEGYKFIIII